MRKKIIETFDFYHHELYHKLPGENFVHHYHPTHELYYLVRGQVSYFVGKQILLLNPGDFIFIPKGMSHYTNYANIANTERFLFSFTDDYLGEDYRRYLKRPNSYNLIHVDPSAQPTFNQVFDLIKQECALNGAYHTEMNRLYLRMLMVLIAHHRISSPEQEFTGIQKIIQDAVTFIYSNYAQEISIESLARQYSLSVGYFSKQFKQFTGIAPSEYLTAVRIDAACRALRDPDCRVIDAALACGFNDSNYFALVFKKVKGITPKKYAIEHRSGETN